MASRVCRISRFIGLSSAIRIRGGDLIPDPSPTAAYGTYSWIWARSCLGLNGFVTYASRPAADALASSPLNA